MRASAAKCCSKWKHIIQVINNNRASKATCATKAIILERLWNSLYF